MPTDRPRRIWLYRRRFWWSAINPDEVLATMDSHTYVRARTRERAIERARRRFFRPAERHEEVIVDAR